MILKKRQALKKEQVCGECKVVVKLKEYYFDTDLRVGKKPWETQKLCLKCGDSKSQKENKND